MEIREALELKNSYLAAYNSGSFRAQATSNKSRAIVKSVLEARPADRLAIGISAQGSKRSNSSARLEIRVQRTDGPAFHEAKRIEMEVHGEARVIVVERLEFPTFKALNEGLKGLFRTPAPGAPLFVGDPVRCRRAGPGTLGGFLRYSDGPALLSSSHVLAAYSSPAEGPDEGDPIYRPPPKFKSLTGDRQVGQLQRWSEFDKAQPNYADAAIAHLSNHVEYEPNVIPRHDNVPAELRGRRLSSMRAISHEEIAKEFQKAENFELLGQTVAKIGGATGYTHGHISAALVEGITAWVPWLGNIIYANIFEITPTDAKGFTEPGDSGSSVFVKDEQLVFGLHCAAADAFDENRTPLGYRLSYACSIQGILYEFDDYKWM